MSRNRALDLLKVLLAVAVIGLHTNIFLEYSPVTHHGLVQGIFRIAVPLFFLINGFFFYSVVQQKTQRTWFGRIGLLYLFWMLVYAPFWIFDSGLTLTTIAKYLLLGFAHLWYLPALFVSAVLIYVLRKHSFRFLLTLSILLFSAGFALQCYQAYGELYLGYLDWRPLPLESYRNAIFIGVPLFALGYFLHWKTWIHQISRAKSRWLLCIALLLTVFESLVHYLFASRATFDILLSLPFSSFALFVFAFQRNNRPSHTFHFGKFANALYFTHGLPLIVLSTFYPLSPTPMMLATVLISALMSILLMRSKRFTALFL